MSRSSTDVAGAPARAVEKRELAQWFLKISDMSEELLSALDTLTDWPEKVRLMQRNWIGKSEGLRFSFVLEDEAGNQLDEKLTVYTTRHDTIFGASFCAISADHALTQRAAAESDDCQAPSRRNVLPLVPARKQLSGPRRKGCRSASMPVTPSIATSALAGLCSQFRVDRLWRRRCVRLSCPRSARPGFRAQVWSGGHPGRGTERTPTPRL